MRQGGYSFRFTIVSLCVQLSTQNRNGQPYQSGGENSGASQAHKHIQFVPVEDESGPPIECLARRAQLEYSGSFLAFLCRFMYNLPTLRQTIFSNTAIICEPYYPTSFGYRFISTRPFGSQTLQRIHSTPRSLDLYYPT